MSKFQSRTVQKAMADSEHGAIHIVLLPYPTQGRINPILQFGKRLAARRGVRCTLTVTRASRPHVAAISDGCDPGGFREAPDVDDYLSRLLRSEATQDRPVHALVYDSFLSWAPQRGGAPRRGERVCAVNVAYEHVFGGRIKLPLAHAGEEPVRLPGVSVSLRLDELPTLMVDTNGCPAYLDLAVNQFKDLDMADHVLVNSLYELQPQEAEHMVSAWWAKTVGPTVPSVYLDNCLPDDKSYGFHLFALVIETKVWLDTRAARSATYIPFGSVTTPTSQQMAKVCTTLTSRKLWVVKASKISKTPEGFVCKVASEDRGFIVTWCPQLEVLAHPAIGCFVMHCGWNSIMEGLSAGIPMVAVPQWFDQPTNAKYIEDVWCVGVRVQPDDEGWVRKEELERCVREVMEEERSEKYEKNAADWKETWRRRGKPRAMMFYRTNYSSFGYGGWLRAQRRRGSSRMARRGAEPWVKTCLMARERDDGKLLDMVRS
uniref:Glycosyltransferase n=1 Tax=Oryza punctata TaxID=4537 RepID=A0A0E0M3G6_ORYPU